jgi:putative transposase
MSLRKDSFEVGRSYHCYNRSIEGRPSFVDSRDYYRFLELLYLANDEMPLRREAFGAQKFEEILRFPRGKRLVSVQAFSLMPDHFHLVLKEIVEGGITSFMRKVGTAYTLYFNGRHKRKGNLFLKPFQSLSVPDERRLQQLVSYVHSSPATLLEPAWRKAPVVDIQFLGERLLAYPYASFRPYANQKAPTSPILDIEIQLPARSISIPKMLQEARLYFADFNVP